MSFQIRWTFQQTKEQRKLNQNIILYDANFKILRRFVVLGLLNILRKYSLLRKLHYWKSEETGSSVNFSTLIHRCLIYVFHCITQGIQQYETKYPNSLLKTVALPPKTLKYSICTFMKVTLKMIAMRLCYSISWKWPGLISLQWHSATLLFKVIHPLLWIQLCCSHFHLRNNEKKTC